MDEKVFLICDSDGMAFILKEDELENYIDENSPAEDVEEILLWADESILGQVYRGAYIAIVRVRPETKVSPGSDG